MSTQPVETKNISDSGTPAERTRSDRAYRPVVDIVEIESELLIRADVPGSSADRVEIGFDKGILTLDARVENRHEGRRRLRTEYGVGDFFRRFQIGEGIDVGSIRAEFRNGVLEVHLPKSEAVLPRKIPVSVKS